MMRRDEPALYGEIESGTRDFNGDYAGLIIDNFSDDEESEVDQW